MRGKKGIFGYTSNLGKTSDAKSLDWFDPSAYLVTSDERLPDDETEKNHFTWAKIVLLMIVAVFLVRLTYLQITEGSIHSFLAEGNRVRRLITVAPRGAILDRKGQALVTNEPGYTLEVIPADLPRTKDARTAILQAVADITAMPLEEIVSLVSKAGLGTIEPIALQSNIDRDKALLYKVKLAASQGVRVSFIPSRKYDSTPGLGHLLGYTSRMNTRDVEKHPDYHPSSPIGRSGVESSYDAYLRGGEGINEVEINAQGEYQRLLRNIPPKEGKTLRLTLDKGLQEEMAAALREAMDKREFKQAVGVASVSYPNYDNNAFANGISNEDYQRFTGDPEKPLIDRAADGLFAPGSTIKPFVAAAALQEKTISSSTRLDTSDGVIEIGPWRFPDWKKHGVTDIKEAIAQSNNIMFYALGGGWKQIPPLGADRLKRYLNLFGFGESPKSDYTVGQEGLIPDPDWKKRVK